VRSAPCHGGRQSSLTLVTLDQFPFTGCSSHVRPEADDFGGGLNGKRIRAAAASIETPSHVQKPQVKLLRMSSH
jgi:hypothetical protein